MGGTRTAIVTGASSGIGAATALEMATRGWRIALGARRVARLEEVAAKVEAHGGSASVHPLDVTEPSSIDAFLAHIDAELGPVDLLVNNAGANRAARIEEATDDELRDDVVLNLLGAMWMTRRLLPGMLSRRRGDVVFVGSDCAQRPRPYQAAYGAAKAGLEAFARTLEMETEGSGVRSILFRVGPTGSEFGGAMPKDRIPAILESWKYWGIVRSVHWMPAESVAKAIVRTVETPVEESYPAVVEIQPGGRKRDRGAEET